MATYERREVTTVRVEYLVPAEDRWGACWVGVYKAVAAAHAELREGGEGGAAVAAADDRIRIFPHDEMIVVSFDKSVDAR